MKTIICLLLLITSIGTYASQFNHITLIIDNETKHDVVLYSRCREIENLEC